MAYAEDIGGHSSAFLVTAIHASACELLSPLDKYAGKFKVPYYLL